MYSTYKKLKKIHKELCKIAIANERAMKDHSMMDDDDMMDDDMEMSALRRRWRRKKLREMAALQAPRGRRRRLQRPSRMRTRRGRDLNSIRARLATLR